MPQFIKDVSPGLAEYISPNVALSTGSVEDPIDFEFGSEVTIDDITVSFGAVTISEIFYLDILYPSSNQIGRITTITAPAAGAMEFFLNAASGVGVAGTGKLWYRIPARAHLLLTPNNPTTAAVAQMVVVGRGG